MNTLTGWRPSPIWLGIRVEHYPTWTVAALEREITLMKSWRGRSATDRAIAAKGRLR